MSEPKKEIASYLWHYRDNPPTHDLEALRRASQILDIVIAHLEKCEAPIATEIDAAFVMKQEMIKSLKEE